MVRSRGCVVSVVVVYRERVLCCVVLCGVVWCGD